MMLPFLPRYIGHRGLTESVLENSLKALDFAYHDRLQCVESDVQLTKDNVPVMLHDETLKRTLALPGHVYDWNYQDIISQLSDTAIKDGHFPTLREYVNRLCQYKMGFDLEIKKIHPNASEKDNKTATHIILNTLKNIFPNAIQFCFVSSFETSCIEQAYDYWPELPRAFLLHEWRDDWYTILSNYHCFALVLNHEILNSERRYEIAQSNTKLIVYTVDTVSDHQRMLDLKVDHIITGNPALLA